MSSDSVSFEAAFAKERKALKLNDESRPLVGLALSGGGIRSATFSLGVLQGLACHRMLSSFDYLSTVSGGGYIGAWLSKWIYRLRKDNSAADAMETVESRLRDGAMPRDRPEPDELLWLRRYSNYLAPKVGLLTVDFLTLVAIWLRNFSLNLVILFGLMVALFLIPLVGLELLARYEPLPDWFGFAALLAAFAMVAAIGIHLWRQSLTLVAGPNPGWDWFASQPGVLTTVILAGALAAVLTPPWLFQPNRSLQDVMPALVGATVSLVVVWLFWIYTSSKRLSNDHKAKKLLRYEAFVFFLSGAVALVALAAGLMLTYLAWYRWVGGGSVPSSVMFVGFGPPIVVLLLSAATALFTGMVGRVFTTASREWWSRLHAWFLVVGGAWLFVASVSLLALPTFGWVSGNAPLWGSAIGVGWIGSLLGSVLSAAPEGATRKMQVRVDQWLNVAATLAVLGVLASAGAVAGLLATTIWSQGGAIRSGLPFGHWAGAIDPQSLAGYLLDGLRTVGAAGFWDGWPPVTLTSGALIGVIALFVWRVDINSFSLHELYKNRLVRCYLGATTKDRPRGTFTGLHKDDDLNLSDLRKQRPLHLFGAALNLTQGKNLAWQERKAAAFTYSPWHCGFALAPSHCEAVETATESAKSKSDFYRRTSGIKVGTAMATSGAAVSPNMGAASNPARAFMLTLFNVRLGHWTPNPRFRKVGSGGPIVSFWPLLLEFFGYSNEERNFVYLSDGGHFENTGVYELVRRQCRVIVAVDAGADPQRRYDDLGEAIRKCRVDLGADIRFDSRNDPSRADLCGESGFAIARIDYGPKVPQGWLVLMKPTLSPIADEPVDVLNYSKHNPQFPQQPTADQFFGESQFESYRQLGLHVASKCMRQHGYLLRSSSVASAYSRTGAAEGTV